MELYYIRRVTFNSTTYLFYILHYAFRMLPSRRELTPFSRKSTCNILGLNALEIGTKRN